MSDSYITNNPIHLPIALVIALALHATVIFWLTFKITKPKTQHSQLELTLARYHDEPPKKADFLSQFNQQGSGSLQNKALPSTTHIADFDTEKIQEVAMENKPNPPQKKSIKNETITSVTVTLNKQVVNNISSLQPADTTNPDMLSLLPPSLRQKIASLEALLRHEKQIYANRPRIKRLTSISSKKEAGALYKEAWRKKVEKIGNIYYPRQSKIKKIYGELGLMVSINKNGSIFNIQVTRSSGYQILDEMAIKIVKLSAPFPKFDKELENYDRVELIRTWRFEKTTGTVSTR